MIGASLPKSSHINELQYRDQFDIVLSLNAFQNKLDVDEDEESESESEDDESSDGGESEEEREPIEDEEAVEEEEPVDVRDDVSVESEELWRWRVRVTRLSVLLAMTWTTAIEGEL